MNKLRNLNIVFYILSSILIVMSIYYLYTQVLTNVRIASDNNNKINLFLENQAKNKHSIDENRAVLLDIQNKLTK